MNKMKIMAARMILAAMAVMIPANAVMASGPPPTAAISCQGCIGMIQTSANSYTVYAVLGATIRLSGNPGYQSYFWTQNGLETNNTQEAKITVIASTQYTLTVTDYGGPEGAKRSTTSSVKIELASGTSQGTCPPDLADISVDADYLNRIVFAVGDWFSLEVPGFDKNSCPGAVFRWIINGGSSSGLVIQNSNNPKTLVFVSKKPDSGKNPLIRAQVCINGGCREKNVSIVVVDNTPPTVAGRCIYTTLLSHTDFDVSCGDAWTGSGYNEYGDFIAEFSATLLDAENHTISSGIVTAKRGETLRSVTLKAGAEGEYWLKVAATDSHGLSATFTEPIFVEFGNTEEDTPIIVVNDTIFCKTGERCPIDASKTEDHGLGTSFRFQSIAGSQAPELLYNTHNALCVTFVCTTVFKYPYAYKVIVTAAYIRNGKVADKYSEKPVTVIVSEQGTRTPTQTAQIGNPTIPTRTAPASPIVSALTPQPPPEIPAKPTPGVSPSAFFAALIAAAIFLRKKSNNH